MILTKTALQALSDREFEALRSLVTSVARGRNQRSPVAKLLAGMAVGDTRLFPWSDVKQLSDYRKHAARRIIGDENANWSARTTPKGIRVRRTA